MSQNNPNVTPDIEAYAKVVDEEARQRFEQAVANLTPQKAVEMLHRVSTTLADQDYFAASIALDHIAEWIRRQEKASRAGLNYEPNTIRWMPGDLVLHDADKKSREMLMEVIGYDAKTGECKTRYVTPEAFGWPKRRVYRNSLKVLHDPGRFGIAVPSSVIKDIDQH